MRQPFNKKEPNFAAVLNEFYTHLNLIRKTIAEGGGLRVYTKRPTRWDIAFLFFILLSYV